MRKKRSSRLRVAYAAWALVVLLILSAAVVAAAEGTEPLEASGDASGEVSGVSEQAGEETGPAETPDDDDLSGAEVPLTAGDQSAPENPNAENPNAENPNAANPNAENPNAENPNAENPDAENPNAENPNAENPNAENPNAGNPDAENPDESGEGEIEEIEDAEVPVSPLPDDGEDPDPDPDEPLQEEPEDPLDENPAEIPSVGDEEEPPPQVTSRPLALKAVWQGDAPDLERLPEFEVLLLTGDRRYTYLLTPGTGVTDVTLPDGVYEVTPGYVPFGYRLMFISADGVEGDSALVTVTNGIPDRVGVTLTYKRVAKEIFGHGLTVDFLVGPGPDAAGMGAGSVPEEETPEAPEESDAAEPPESPLTADKPPEDEEAPEADAASGGDGAGG